MDKVKISDFVDVWAQTIGLTESQYIDAIKNDIYKRLDMYQKDFPSISIEDDPCDAYIIRATDGKYSLEDFLLNRLMLGLRIVDFNGALPGNSGDYSADRKVLGLDVKKLI